MFAGVRHYRYMVVWILGEKGAEANAIFDTKLRLARLSYQGETAIGSWSEIKKRLNGIISEITKRDGWSMQVIHFTRGERDADRGDN